MADEAKKDPAKRTVWVQSVLRPNYGGSYRIGRYWPSSEATEAEVTDEELKALVEDPLLHVFDQRPRKLKAAQEPAEAAAEPEAKAAPPADAKPAHKR